MNNEQRRLSRLQFYILSKKIKFADIIDKAAQTLYNDIRINIPYATSPFYEKLTELSI